MGIDIEPPLPPARLARRDLENERKNKHGLFSIFRKHNSSSSASVPIKDAQALRKKLGLDSTSTLSVEKLHEQLQQDADSFADDLSKKYDDEQNSPDEVKHFSSSAHSMVSDELLDSPATDDVNDIHPAEAEDSLSSTVLDSPAADDIANIPPAKTEGSPPSTVLGDFDSVVEEEHLDLEKEFSSVIDKDVPDTSSDSASATVPEFLVGDTPAPIVDNDFDPKDIDSVDSPDSDFTSDVPDFKSDDTTSENSFSSSDNISDSLASSVDSDFTSDVPDFKSDDSASDNSFSSSDNISDSVTDQALDFVSDLPSSESDNDSSDSFVSDVPDSFGSTDSSLSDSSSDSFVSDVPDSTGDLIGNDIPDIPIPLPPVVNDSVSESAPAVDDFDSSLPIVTHHDSDSDLPATLSDVSCKLDISYSSDIDHDSVISQSSSKDVTSSFAIGDSVPESAPAVDDFDSSLPIVTHHDSDSDLPATLPSSDAVSPSAIVSKSLIDESIIDSSSSDSSSDNSFPSIDLDPSKVADFDKDLSSSADDFMSESAPSSVDTSIPPPINESISLPPVGASPTLTTYEPSIPEKRSFFDRLLGIYRHPAPKKVEHAYPLNKELPLPSPPLNPMSVPPLSSELAPTLDTPLNTIEVSKPHNSMPESIEANDPYAENDSTISMRASTLDSLIKSGHLDVSILDKQRIIISDKDESVLKSALDVDDPFKEPSSMPLRRASTLHALIDSGKLDVLFVDKSGLILSDEEASVKGEPTKEKSDSSSTIKDAPVPSHAAYISNYAHDIDILISASRDSAAQGDLLKAKLKYNDAKHLYSASDLELSTKELIYSSLKSLYDFIHLKLLEQEAAAVLSE